jgi:hypothetical protein
MVFFIGLPLVAELDDYLEAKESGELLRAQVGGWQGRS